MGSKNFGGNDFIMLSYKNRIYWMNAAGTTNPNCVQSNILRALRLKGYKGELNDMLSAFYLHEFSINDLTEGLAVHL